MAIPLQKLVAGIKGKSADAYNAVKDYTRGVRGQTAGINPEISPEAVDPYVTMGRSNTPMEMSPETRREMQGYYTAQAVKSSPATMAGAGALGGALAGAGAVGAAGAMGAAQEQQMMAEQQAAQQEQMVRELFLQQIQGKIKRTADGGAALSAKDANAAWKAIIGEQAYQMDTPDGLSPEELAQLGQRVGLNDLKIYMD
jgi:hypothetical protein